jgi:hypothetical protein
MTMVSGVKCQEGPQRETVAPHLVYALELPRNIDSRDTRSGTVNQQQRGHRMRIRNLV